MKDDVKKKQAIALSYQAESDLAPKLVAKGSGFVAEKIIERAKENKVPIQEDASLVALLGQLEINEAIPEQLYEVVAEIFAFIYRIDKNS